jgi:hypothetical protein
LRVGQAAGAAVGGTEPRQQQRLPVHV